MLRLLLPLPALGLGPMLLAARQPIHPVALKDAVHGRDGHRDPMKALQVVRDPAEALGFHMATTTSPSAQRAPSTGRCLRAQSANDVGEAVETSRASAIFSSACGPKYVWASK